MTILASQVLKVANHKYRQRLAEKCGSPVPEDMEIQSDQVEAVCEILSGEEA